MLAAIGLVAMTCDAPAMETPRGLIAGADPFPSTYQPRPDPPVAIVGAHVLTGTGEAIERGTLLIRDGKIESIGPDLPVPDGYERIDGSGRWVTPGLIDAHSHLGASPAPATPLSGDHNEDSAPNTAEVSIEHSIWPQDPQFRLARAGGVTTLHILPGSGNLFGGRGVTLRNVPAETAQAMRFPGAPYGLKMACGENPKRTFGGKGRSPATNMGNVALFRRAWIDAADYVRRWDRWRASGTGDPPMRDLQLETLAGVLRGEILVQTH